MSTERIDHAEKARELAEVVVTGDDQIAVILQCLANSTGAQVHATLALVEAQRKANEIAERAVEQQRIANLIELGQEQKLHGSGEASLPSWDAQYQLRPEIAEALGLS